MTNEKGFSLIELLVVVVIIGVVAAISVPAYQRGILAAEIRSAQATMKIMSSSQAMFFSQNQRFATLNELNTLNSNTLLKDKARNGFAFEMVSEDPTELKKGYTIMASRSAIGLVWQFELTNEGIKQVYPANSEF